VRFLKNNSIPFEREALYIGSWFIHSGVVMEIGQKVRFRRLRERASQVVIAHLGKVGTIKQFRMVDGSSVGVVVKFEDGFTTWFFEDELESAS
jgi:hypothetical protein